MPTDWVQRGGARGFGMGATLAAVAVLAGGCMETQRSIGDECLKNGDCLSGICSSLTCAAPPPLVDTGAVADAASAVETGTAPTADASEAGEAVDANDEDAAAEQQTDADDGADGSPSDDGGSVD
jgi:hypothetical protein